jgi:hypothetical protein
MLLHWHGVRAIRVVACVRSSPATPVRGRARFPLEGQRRDRLGLPGRLVHLLTKDFIRSAGPRAGVQGSDLLVEADLAELLSPTAQMQMLARGMLPASTTLDAVVPATLPSSRHEPRSSGCPSSRSSMTVVARVDDRVAPVAGRL